MVGATQTMRQFFKRNLYSVVEKIAERSAQKVGETLLDPQSFGDLTEQVAERSAQKVGKALLGSTSLADVAEQIAERSARKVLDGLTAKAPATAADVDRAAFRAA